MFKVQTKAFVVPSLVQFTSDNTTTKLDVVIGILKDSQKKRYIGKRKDQPPSVRIQAPVEQQGTLGPAIQSFDEIPLNIMEARKRYSLWSGKVDIGSVVTGAVSVAVLDENGEEIDVLLL
jgi:hypothetical protein